MRLVQKLLILKQIVADVKLFAPSIRQMKKPNQTYQEREKFIKDNLEMDK